MLKDTLRLNGIKENKVFIGPKSVNLHITNICNLNCSYCWFHSTIVNKKYKGKYMDFILFKKTINDFRGLGVKSLTLSGEGETTLHPKIKEMIEYAKEKGFMLTILTNGTFGKDIIKHIFRVDSMVINLATLSVESYREIQSESGCETMKRVIENIIMISKIKKKMRLKKPQVSIGFILNEKNYSEVEKLFSFACKYDIKVRFRLMKARKENERLIISKSSADKLRRSLENIIRKDKGITNAKSIHSKLLESNFLKKTEVFYPFENCKRIFYFDNFNKRKIKCYMGWYFSHIDMKGNVRFCCQNPFLIAGNIKQNPFKKIWNSKKYMKLRLKCKRGIDMNKFKWMECRYCPFAKDNKEIEISLDTG